MFHSTCTPTFKFHSVSFLSQLVFLVRTKTLAALLLEVDDVISVNQRVHASVSNCHHEYKFLQIIIYSVRSVVIYSVPENAYSIKSKISFSYNFSINYHRDRIMYGVQQMMNTATMAIVIFSVRLLALRICDMSDLRNRNLFPFEMDVLLIVSRPFKLVNTEKHQVSALFDNDFRVFTFSTFLRFATYLTQNNTV